MKIIWSPLSLDRATEIAEYIAQDNPSVAADWVETLFAKVELLESSPSIGRVVPEANRDDIRELIYGNYRIVYLNKENQIFILTIRHGKQIMPIGELVA
ncbi:MAG: type II toxin-antitoxin system RelE/ParE family toxin [Desulfobulbaceae bacterium]|nr:type II toxin-antitoxin system RelE/ParE family toxin [Desulfobulbaceae bacterium]